MVPAHDPLIVGPRGQTPQLCPSPSQALPNTALPTSALSHLGPSHLAAAQGRGGGACPRPTDRWPCEQTPRSPCTRTRASPPAQVTHSQSVSGTPAAPGGSRGRPRRTFSRRDTAPAGQQRMLARESSRLAVSGCHALPTVLLQCRRRPRLDVHEGALRISRERRGRALRPERALERAVHVVEVRVPAKPRRATPSAAKGRVVCRVFAAARCVARR